MIEIENLSVRYGNFVAVDRVDLTIEPGSFFSIVGPSGCGKTTLLRVMAGFVSPSDGVIRIEGAAMNDVPPNRRPTNLVFQNYAIFPHLTVGENIAYGVDRSLSRAQKAAVVSKALSGIRMEGFQDRKPYELSGGQRQRVALARALVRKPKVLLLDEPLGALDKKLREEMQTELREVQRSVGITFVFVTHDQHEAFVMSDKMAVMSKGRVEQIGRPQNLYDRPNTLMVAEFLGDMNRLSGTVTAAQSGCARIAIDGIGELKATYSVPPRPGQTAQLCIRPEYIEPTKQPDGVNRIVGKIVGQTYAGDHWQLLVSAPHGQRFTVKVSKSLMEDLKSWDHEAVAFNFAAADAVVLSNS